MNTSRTLRSAAAALLLLSPSLGAQTTIPQLIDYVAQPSTFGTPGAWGRSVKANVTAPDFADAVFVQGQRLAVFCQAFLHSILVQVPDAAFDVDVVKGAVAGGRDGLVIVNATGMHIVSFDQTSGQFVSTMIEGDLCLGALKVRCGDLNGPGTARDFVAVGSDARTVHVFVDGAHAASWSEGADIRGIELVRWDATIQPKAAVLTDEHLEIRDLGGSLVTVLDPRGAFGRTLGVLHGSTRDRVVVASHDGTIQYLNVVRMGAPAELYSDVPGFPISALASGDMDGDLKEDLVIASQTDLALRVVPGLLPSPTSLDPETSSIVGGSLEGAPGYETWWPPSLLDASGAFATGAPLCADLDLDGHADIVLGLRIAEALENVSLFARFAQPVPGGPLRELQGSDFLQKFKIEEQESGYRPTLSIHYETVPVAAQYVRAVLWRNPVGPPTLVDKMLHTADLHQQTVPPGGGGPSINWNGTPGDASFTLAPSEEFGPWCGEPLRCWIKIQAYHMNGTTMVVDNTRIALLAVDDSEAAIDAVEDASTYLAEDLTPTVPCWSPSEAGTDPIHIHALVERRFLPPTVDNLLPIEPPPFAFVDWGPAL